MKKTLFILLTIVNFTILRGQSVAKVSNVYENAATKLSKNSPGISFGGYGQVDYNQPFGMDKKYNGTLDVHRMVLLVGYRFNKRLNLVTEIEWEHVKEISIEQAFVNYSVKPYLQIQAGLMLVPMGLINLYHEPTTFNGVERPLLDKSIAPTTWREVGFGMAGNLTGASMKYQLYLFGGFKSYNGDALISGKNGFRKARQKGALAIVGSPNLSARIEYYGVLGLNLGFSAYVGKTSSTLYNGVARTNESQMAKADSSVVGLAMIGADLRYQKKGLQLRSQWYYGSISNTEQYNFFGAKAGEMNDVGKTMSGFYVEAAYDVLRLITKTANRLNLFARYTSFDTQRSTVAGVVKNPAYQIKAITTGLGWRISKGLVLKSDIQFYKTGADIRYSKTFNAGVALWF